MKIGANNSLQYHLKVSSELLADEILYLDTTLYSLVCRQGYTSGLIAAIFHVKIIGMGGGVVGLGGSQQQQS